MTVAYKVTLDGTVEIISINHRTNKVRWRGPWDKYTHTSDLKYTKNGRPYFLNYEKREYLDTFMLE